MVGGGQAGPGSAPLRKRLDDEPAQPIPVSR
jgi:hypothetical protein